jgi:hypothetical protein
LLQQSLLQNIVFSPEDFAVLSDNPLTMHADPQSRGEVLNARNMTHTPQRAE